MTYFSFLMLLPLLPLMIIPGSLLAGNAVIGPEAGSLHQSLRHSGPPESPEAAIRSLYDLVTFPAGTSPDWEAVRNLFIPEAVIVLRSSRTAQSVFSVDGFVQDFVNFIERAEVIKTGFEEKIVSVRLTEFGDIAHAFVIYEARIPGKMPRPQTGVDSFQLIRQDGVWKIASIINELPGPDRPVPEAIRN